MNQMKLGLSTFIGQDKKAAFDALGRPSSKLKKETFTDYIWEMDYVAQI